MAAHSSLAWEIPWTEGPGGLQSMGSWRVGHTERVHTHTHTHTHTCNDSWVYSCYFCSFDRLCKALLLFRIYNQTLFNFALSSHSRIRPEEQIPEYNTTVLLGWGVRVDFSFVCMFVCIYFLQWGWVTPGIGKLAILLKCQAPGQPKCGASTCVQQNLKDLRGMNRQFLQAVGLAKGMAEEGHVGKPGFLCSCELDPVGQWWRWGQESQSSASPGSEKIKAESQPHYSFSNDRCFLHMAESAKQAATALPSPGSRLSSRDKHQAGDCKTRSILAVAVRAFHREHWGAGPVQLWERTRACWEESAGRGRGGRSGTACGPGAWWEHVGLDESWLGVGWFACERWASFAVPHHWLALCWSNKNTKNEDFLVVQWLRLLSSQCRGPRFDPWSGN